MSLPVTLVDASTGRPISVSKEGSINTVQHTHPPKDEPLAGLPFRQYFTVDGTSSGSNDMRVDGSTTVQDFTIKADPEKDIFIYSASVLLSDAGAGLNEFCNLPALTNGVKLEWKTQDLGNVEIHEGIKTNFEFVRLGMGSPSIGDGANAFRANNVSGAAEGYIPFIEFRRLFGLPWGIRIRARTEDTLSWYIQDDLSSGITEFNIVAYGVQF
tara:strand:+ start:7761 stop:8399 length:639 start_codon:yes stop_codon:yes gene_type:complete